MEFNKNWTKIDNDKLRELIKEGRSVSYIREYFGNDKLFFHPYKKYHQSGKLMPNFKEEIKDFSGFINEIKYEPLKTDFIYDFEKSNFTNEFNYFYTFQTNSGNRYVLDFIYLNDKIGPYVNKDIYNVSFSLESNRDILNYKNYEDQTNLGEEHEIIKRLIFIFRDFDDRFGNNCVYMIGETEDKRKIKWYRNIIGDSFDDIKEVTGVSSFTNGLNAYYYEIKRNLNK